MPRPTRRSRLQLAALCALVLAGPLCADGIKLVYGTQPGDKSTYQMVMEGRTTVYVGDRTQTSNIKTEMILTQSVKGFKDGVIALETKIDSGMINVNGQPSPIPSIGQKIETDMKPSGEIVNTQPFGGLDLKQMQLVFPDKPLNVGDSWNSQIAPSTQVPVRLHVSYKVVGVEKIKDFDCVKIASQVRSDKESQIEGLSLDVKADGNIYFAYKAGKMVKNDVKSQMNMILKRVINNQTQSIITKMEMDMKMEYQY